MLDFGLARLKGSEDAADERSPRPALHPPDAPGVIIGTPHTCARNRPAASWWNSVRRLGVRVYPLRDAHGTPTIRRRATVTDTLARCAGARARLEQAACGRACAGPPGDWNAACGRTHESGFTTSRTRSSNSMTRSSSKLQRHSR